MVEEKFTQQDLSEVETNPPPRSLRELIDRVTGRGLKSAVAVGDAGLAEVLPFPFLAIVGQKEMKLALLLNLVNPMIGGVLLIGARGTGKTTAVRSLVDLLPKVSRSLCYYGCVPEDVEAGGMDALCPDCARKFAMGEPLTTEDLVRLVELPLNAQIEDVIGGLDERAIVHERLRLRRGILAHADQNLLYVDEVNLLEDNIVDAILDAAAQGSFTVRRGSLAATYRSRFVLIGSMNPEEGRLRPQILDRFGLRVVAEGLQEPQERLEAYRRSLAYRMNPRLVLSEYALDTQSAMEEIQAARDRLPGIKISDEVAQKGIKIIEQLEIDSLRAEITLFEAARAYAVIDGRDQVEPDDLQHVGVMALRMRRSAFMHDYHAQQGAEAEQISAILSKIL